MAQESEVLTVLFTDIVGSTELLGRLGDDAADDLRRDHFAALRAAIAEHHGREVKSLGDGLMVAFASARDAVACATAMQQAAAGGLGLRVGLDAGEPIREGDDLFGTPVVVARRLCDAADGGQVLVSDLVRLLLGRRVLDRLVPVGKLDLKGLDDPVEAHELRWRAATATAIRLCGGPTVTQNGDRLDGRLPSRQSRMLFALLVLHRDRALSREALADALWDTGAAPRSRDNSLRALLSGVRQVFGPESIEGRGSVRLVLPEGTTVDVEDARAALTAAERALADGDLAGAAGGARQAGELTAEELLPGLSAAWIDQARNETEDLGLRALEVAAEAALRDGRVADGARAARRVVERAPFRETAHALLIEALAARGNVAEASLAFDRLRTLLREELGSAPAPDVVALYERVVLRASSASPVGTDAVPFPAALARAGERPFVARAAEREALRTAWDTTRAAAARLTVIAGEPGIGKTSLAATFAREAHDGGATVLLGRCHAEGLVPYEPFVEALRQLPTEPLPERREVLARVMPELASGGSPAPAGDDAAERYLLYEAVARTLVDRTGVAPVVLVLEDLHWADPPTLLLLKHVLRAAEGAPLLVLATYRTTEVAGTEKVVDTVADLGRELAVDRITVDGLADAEVAQLIHALEGRPPSPLLGLAMRRDTTGNPLFVGQLLRHLSETGALVDRDGELAVAAGARRLGVPDSVTELVGRRLAGLDDATVSALRTAAVVGRTFSHDLIAAAGSMRLEPTLDALDTATAAGLVEDSGDGRHTFVHALVRDAIYERTGAARRRALHRAVADTLEQAPGPDPAELALHFLAAGDRARGGECSVASAVRALEQFAYEDAAAHYRRALEAFGEDDRTRRCDLLLALGDAEARAGDTARSKLAYRMAADAAAILGLPDQHARAALGYGGRIVWEVGRDDPYLRTLLERALEARDETDDVLCVMLLARLGAGPLRARGIPPERRWAMTEEALDRARRLARPETVLYALSGYIPAHHSPDYTPEQVGACTEMIRLATECGDYERALEGHEHRQAARIELGDMPGAVEDLEAMATLAAELRQPSQAWYVAVIRAQHALLEGRDDAETLIAAAHGVGERAQSWNASVAHLLQLYVLRRLQDRLAEVADLVRDGAERYGSYPICHCAYVQTLAALGDEGAGAALADVVADDIADIPFDESWLVSVSLLADAAATLGDLEAAAILYRRLAPYADRVAVSTPEIALGAVARCLGLLATTLGQGEDAARHFEEARAVNQGIGARPWLAYTERDAAALS